MGTSSVSRSPSNVEPVPPFTIETLQAPQVPTEPFSIKQLAIRIGCTALTVIFCAAVYPFLILKLCFIKTPSQKPVAVMIKAKEDETRAFNQLNYDATLFNSYYSLKSFEAENINEVASIINRVGMQDPIQVLWIRAHGTPYHMLLGKAEYKNNQLELNDRVIHWFNLNLLRIPFQKLTPNAVIVLESCNVGNKVNGTMCLAEKIAALAPGRNVFAPNSISWSTMLSITSLNPLRVTFRKGPIVSAIDGLTDCIAGLLATTFGIEFRSRSVTARYLTPTLNR